MAKEFVGIQLKLNSEIMKKDYLLFIILVCFTISIEAQNPQWIQYTNGNDVWALADEGNILWIGTFGGLVKLDKTTGTSTFYNNANSDLPYNYVTDIAIDDNGTKWIGTYYGGMAAFDGINWVIYNTSNSGLPNNFIHSIAIDANGTKCIGT